MRSAETGRLEIQLPAAEGVLTSPVLFPAGSVAWIVRGPLQRYVQVGQPRRVEVVDAGPDIHAQSLARSGSRIYWLRGGVAKTALLS